MSTSKFPLGLLVAVVMDTENVNIEGPPWGSGRRSWGRKSGPIHGTPSVVAKRGTPASGVTLR